MACLSCFMLSLHGTEYEDHSSCPFITYEAIIAYNKFNSDSKYMRLSGNINVTIFIQQIKRRRSNILYTSLSNLKHIKVYKNIEPVTTVKIDDINLKQIRLFHPALNKCKIYELACWFLKYKVFVEADVDSLKKWINLLLGKRLLSEEFICKDISFEAQKVTIFDRPKVDHIMHLFKSNYIFGTDIDYAYIKPSNIEPFILGANNHIKTVYGVHLLSQWVSEDRDSIVSGGLILYRNVLLYII